MKYLICLITILIIVSAGSVTNATDWLTGPSGSNIRDWSVTEECVWLATDDCVVRWDKNDLTNRIYTVDDGLSRNNVSSIDTDSAGVVWMGMFDHIQSFDGQTFTTYTPEPALGEYNYIWSVFVDNEDIVWVGTCRGGVYRFDGSSWTLYSAENSGIPLICVKDMACQSDGTMWFNLADFETVPADLCVPANGMARFDGETWTHYTAENSGLSLDDINSIFVDSKDRIWFMSRHFPNNEAPGINYIDMFDGTAWMNYEGTALGVYGAGEDAEGNLWFSEATEADRSGLVSFDGETWTSVDLKTLSDEPLIGFMDVCFDADNVMWLIGYRASYIYGLHRYDGSTFTDLSVDAPQINGFVNDVLVDNGNNFWIATDAGITKFDGERWENIDLTFDDVESISGSLYTRSQLELMTNKVKSLAVDHDGVVWAGSEYGIRSWDGVAWNLHDYRPDDYSFNSVWSIVVDDDNVKWFSNLTGAASYDGSSWYYPDVCSCSFQAMDSAVDKDGVIWFCRPSQVWTYDGAIWTVYNQEDYDWNEILENSNVVYPFRDGIEHRFDYSPLVGMQRAVAVDDDDVKWFCGNAGIWSFDGATWTSYVDKAKEIAGPTYYDEAYVSDVIVDGDNIKWFAIYGKLTSFDGANWTVHDEELTGHVRRIAIDGNEVLWLVSDEGVGNVRSIAKESLLPGSVTVEKEEQIPSAFSIIGNYPNPFNPSTAIVYTVPEADYVELSIYNVSGQKVRDLVARTVNPGTHHAVWDGRNNHGETVSSGIYFSRLKMRDRVTANRMTFVK